MPEQLLDDRRTAGLAVVLSPPSDWLSRSAPEDPAPAVDVDDDEPMLPEAWLG